MRKCILQYPGVQQYLVCNPGILVVCSDLRTYPENVISIRVSVTVKIGVDEGSFVYGYDHHI